MYISIIIVSLIAIITQCKVLTQVGRIYLEDVGKEAIENSAFDGINNRIFTASEYSTGLNVLSIAKEDDFESFDIQYESFISFKSITSKRWFPKDKSAGKITIDDITATIMSPKNYLLALAEPKFYSYYEGYLVVVDTKELKISKVIKLDNCFAPEHMEITNNGNIIVIACESSPSRKTANGYSYSIPKGIVKIVDVRDLKKIKQYNLDFDAFNWIFEEDYEFGYDIEGRMHSSIYKQFKRVPFSQNAEPEYVTISDNDKYAFISLQDINAMAVIQLNDNNIERSRIINVYGLGLHSINAYDNKPNSYGMDISDQDGINIKKYPNLYALKQPDAIKYFEQKGKHYILTANEGTEKNFDESRIVNLKLNETHFDGYDITKLQQGKQMGRLQVSNLFGYQMDGVNKIYNTLYTFGSRNFDIFEWNPVADTLKSVYNSKDDFEQITASILGKEGFNSHNRRSPSFDKASDNQGPEPESIQYYRCNNNNQFAFIGLEKTSGIFTYDVNNVKKVKFIEYTTNRNYSLTYSSNDRPSEAVGDIEPSDMKIIHQRYFGRPLLMVSNEDSSSLTLYAIDCGENKNNENENSNNAELSDVNSKNNPFKIAPSSKWYIDATVIIGVTLLFGLLTYVCCRCCAKRRTHERIPDTKNEQMLVQVM